MVGLPSWLFWASFTILLISTSLINLNTSPKDTNLTVDTTMIPTPLIVEATGRHTATVIFAHGLGDTGYGWLDIIKNWRLRNHLNQVKFVLPNAPTIPITCNGGYKMPGWFDVVSLDGTIESLKRDEDEKGMLATRSYFESLIKKELDAGISPSRVLIGGFSQGGAMALLTGLTGQYKVGGIVALSCWLALGDKFKSMVKEENKKTPIFMGHGRVDPIVPLEFNQLSRETLKKEEVEVEYKAYDMSHSACPEEIDDVTRFLERLVGAQQE